MSMILDSTIDRRAQRADDDHTRSNIGCNALTLIASYGAVRRRLATLQALSTLYSVHVPSPE